MELGGRSSTACISAFLEKNLRNVKGYLIVHDRLAANRSKRVQDLFTAAGAKTLLTPAAACPLSAVETMFAITKARYRKWLMGLWGEATHQDSMNQLKIIYGNVSQQEAERVSKCAFKVYEQVLHGQPC